MTMTMTSSQFGLEDMEAILWEASSPMVDAMDSLMFQSDREDQQNLGGTSFEGDTPPVSPLTSSPRPSPPNFYSPPASPPANLLHGDKVEPESDMLSMSWLGDPGPLRYSQTLAGDSKDMLSDLDWMAEKMDLSEFDLDSLIGSCSPPAESPAAPQDLLASLNCSMELESLPLPPLPTPVLQSLSEDSHGADLAPSPGPVCPDSTVIEDESYVDGQEVPSSPLCVPEAQEELEIKCEPASPDPVPPVLDSPSSPAYTLDLGSEVDVSETEVKPVVVAAAAVVPQLPRIVLSLSPTRIVLVLAPKNEIGVTTAPEVIRCSPAPSPPHVSSRSRPYPDPKASPPPPTATCIKVKTPRVSLKMPKDKKSKKMEQNKTAATRYRQKKRAEQDALSEEHALLERKNVELTERAESMAREIAYLKELMEEVRMTRLQKGLTPDP